MKKNAKGGHKKQAGKFDSLNAMLIAMYDSQNCIDSALPSITHAGHNEIARSVRNISRFIAATIYLEIRMAEKVDKESRIK